MTDMMDMSDPDVQAMLEADKQEALARIRAAKTYDVPCWFSPEATNVTDIGWIVSPAHYWTQVEPNGPNTSAPDMDTLRSKCEALVDHSVLLELQNPEEVK